MFWLCSIFRCSLFKCSLVSFDCSQPFNKLILWCKEQCNTHDDNLQQINEAQGIQLAGDHPLDSNDHV